MSAAERMAATCTRCDEASELRADIAAIVAVARRNVQRAVERQPESVSETVASCVAIGIDEETAAAGAWRGIAECRAADMLDVLAEIERALGAVRP